MNTLPVFVAASSRISEYGPEEGKLGWGYCVVTPVNWQSSLDSYIEGPVDDGWNKITSQSSAGITTLAVGANLGYARSRRFSVGVGGFMYMTDINMSKSRYDDWDYDLGDNYWTLSSSSSTSISAMHLGLTAGLSAEPRKGMSLGLVVRSPGFGISASGTHIENQVTVDIDPGSGDYAYDQRSAREEDVPVEWKMPMEIVGGVAFDIGRDQFEMNVSYRHGAGDYEVFPSGFYDTRTVDDVGVYTEGVAPRSALTTTQQETVNFSAGYRRYLSEKSRLHAGFSTAFSPVRDSPEEGLFNSVDLMTFTVGMSSLTENTMTTYGLVFQWGGGNVTLLDLSDYSYTSGDLSVMTVGFVLGASFKL